MKKTCRGVRNIWTSRGRRLQRCEREAGPDGLCERCRKELA